MGRPHSEHRARGRAGGGSAQRECGGDWGVESVGCFRVPLRLRPPGGGGEEAKGVFGHAGRQHVSKSQVPSPRPSPRVSGEREVCYENAFPNTGVDGAAMSRGSIGVAR